MKMRDPAKCFEELIVWQKAHQFTLTVYRITTDFPKSEIYGLTSQFRRAAISVAANIAEGFKKRGKADKARFFNISQGSLDECKYYIVLTKDLKYGETEELHALWLEVSKLLNAYTQSILKSIK